ncbi:MAG: hypothetical protein QXQ11_07075 [Candidatus Bathyarchaeia archaeon]
MLTRRILILIILVASSILYYSSSIIPVVNAAEQQIRFLPYATEGGVTYNYFWGPWDWSYYYTYYYSPHKVPVTIRIEGLPSQYFAILKVDGSSACTIPGGGTVYVEVNWRVAHIFTVQSYVEGVKGERFHCKANSWYLERFSAPTREAKATNTFTYTVEYLLSVSSPYGDAAKISGWYSKGSSVTLSTPNIVEVSKGVREVFDSWTVDRSLIKNSTTNIVLNSPVEAKAEYHKEYYLQVRSDYGTPSGSGWYKEGSIASIEVEKELPLEGLMGFLGGKRIFDGWSGGVASRGNAADVNMDSPKTVAARWREDYSKPHTILALTAIIIVVASIAVYRSSIAIIKKRTSPPEERSRELRE